MGSKTTQSEAIISWYHPAQVHGAPRVDPAERVAASLCVVTLTPRLAEGGLHDFSLYSRPVP
jgi:hypothetical protein